MIHPDRENSSWNSPPKSWVKKSSGHHGFLDLWPLDFIFCAWKKQIIKTYDSVNGGIRKEIQRHWSFFGLNPHLLRALRVSWSLKTPPKPSTKIPWKSSDGNAFKVKGSKALPRLATEDPKTRPISSQKLLEMTLMRIIPRSCEVFSPNLVGGWTNPFEKCESNWVHLPQIGVNIKNIWNHHLEMKLNETKWNQMKLIGTECNWNLQFQLWLRDLCSFFWGGKSLFQSHIGWKFCEESTHLIKS